MSKNKKVNGFTLYHSGGDEQIFIDDQGQKEKNNFVFTGFGNGIHPYHQKHYRWMVKMLATAGVILNIKNVPTVDDMGKNSDNGEFETEDLCLPKDARPSFDGKTYMLIQDTEMGRGWAVLLWMRGGSGQIITQDHRDNVRDELMQGDWIRSFGISYNQKEVKDLSKI